MWKVFFIEVVFPLGTMCSLNIGGLVHLDQNQSLIALYKLGVGFNEKVVCSFANLTSTLQYPIICIGIKKCAKT